jgi:hypothetical protein
MLTIDSKIETYHLKEVFANFPKLNDLTFHSFDLSSDVFHEMSLFSQLKYVTLTQCKVGIDQENRAR